MAHHKRKRPRFRDNRHITLERTEKGHGQRAKYSVARWIAQFNDKLKQYQREA